jgi:hypothetical protein
VNALRPVSNDSWVVLLLLALAFYSGVFRDVGVVRVGHDTIVDDELPGRWQKTTLTAPHAIVFAEPLFIITVRRQGTVDETLLGEADWCRVVSLGDGALEGSDGSKGPAGTTAALVLNRSDVSLSEVIDGGRNVNGLEAAAAKVSLLSSVVTKGVAPVVGFGTSAAKHLHVLLRLEVGSPVVGEDEGVGIGIVCVLTVVVGDLCVVQMVTALLPGERAGVRHVLVVFGAEL